ncbi:3-keto-disaccharide hydrolase [Sediminibacterium soli]|uniref:3-keto-disaccharide hydrolase n=1 Tax=Sediminibacterium soli TaxID=2698829 RepID=UPI00137A5B5C|nr:DUF1080 domain-containing protein [Sediminibacterium soli]NCI45830.1 DUF1080 domain-containing protein [Sediminibacterium soli]
MKTRLLLLTCFLQVSVVFAQKQNSSELFDGKTLQGWRTYQHKPADSWFVVDGMLANKGNKDPNTRHADLITEKQYENFALSVDWKIAPQANSGILYLVTEDNPASYQSGPEYQLIDDKGYPAKLEEWQKTGANYAMDPPLTDATKPAGEWNHTEIIVNKGNVTHWLNGKKVAEYTIGSDSWNQHRTSGKWKDTKPYGLAKKGHIALQDHGGEAWFRNIRIREL